MRPECVRLVEQLVQLRLHANSPSESWLARRIGYSRQSVSAVLNGRRLPRWEFVEKFAAACGAEQAKVTELHEIWVQANLTGKEHGPPAPSDPPVAQAFHSGEKLDITWYRDNEEFYGAGADRIGHARSQIRLTYVRQHPPTSYTSAAAKRYFETMLDWARLPGARSVRRIIGVRMHDVAMLTWLREHFAATQDLLNYEARVLTWTPRSDGLNMALFDDSTTFLAFSGRARQGLNGFSVDDPRFLRYFDEHFEQLWAPLVPLDDYLAELG
jgi:transcriptional regulator with XRE-family HTH domain